MTRKNPAARRQLSAEEEAMIEAMRKRIEAEEAGPEMVDVLPEAQWLEQTIAELHARPHLWPALQKAMKHEAHRRADTPKIFKDAIRSAVNGLAAGGMKKDAAVLDVAETWGLTNYGATERQMREIVWPQKRRKKLKKSTK